MTQPIYRPVDANPDFASLEDTILGYWNRNRVFETSVSARPEKKDGASNAYVFYDGPPFANGLPHYGHLLTGYVKDAVARYHTMKGSRVERRFGWDCHGLPAEMGAEKELGISGRAAIQEFGIDKFNEHCRTSVMKYTQDWRYYVTRQGRWVDFDRDYKTMDITFMESCLWAFKELYGKGLVYESMRVMPYSWAAETPVSNFETRIDNATREREDKAATVAFRLKDLSSFKNLPFLHDHKDGVSEAYIYAWTTTPWTLPANLALAVNGTMAYVAVIQGRLKRCDIVSFDWFRKNHTLFRRSGFDDEQMEALKNGKTIFHGDEEGESIESGYGWADYIHVVPFMGTELEGLTYEPIFPYFSYVGDAFRVLEGGDAVSEGEGTGIVHMAPGFGEVDQKICADNGIEVIVPVDEKGRFTHDIFDLDDLKLEGLVVVPDSRIAFDDITVSDEDKAIHIEKKDVQKYGLANMRIVRWLKAHGKLVKDEPYKHNYPHCWRTDTPLIYRAMSSWYVNVQKIKDNMAANNQTINWIPDHVKNGQMGKGIESAPDWSISRNRFWGTPIPIWKSPSGKIHVIGSIAELKQLSGHKVTDLHRPYIDEVTFVIDGEEYTRIEDVFDCWFESGSMPFAQVHYPFANKEWFENHFPADFITEYIAQTRGWFYTLQVLSAALFGKAPFENCICHGVVIDEETGLKYSKRLKNYKDPKEVMDVFGADALRWMMLSSPVMRGADLAVDPEGKFIRDVVRLNIKPIWNAYNFFTLYANADGIGAKRITTSGNLLDRYVLAKYKAAVAAIGKGMDAYDLPTATTAITAFFEVLNNWYIRRSRPRFWAEEKSADKQAAYDTLFTVLEGMCRAAAPLLPFTLEAVYMGLTRADASHAKQSVHLQDFPDVSAIAEEPELIADMDRVRDACNAVLSIRSAENIRIRQPLASATLYGTGATRLKPYGDLIADEGNVKDIRFADELDGIATFDLTIHFPVAGKRLGGKMKSVAAAARSGDWKREGDRMVVGGEPMEPEEYVLRLKPVAAKGTQVLASNDALVLLDTAVTSALEAEGIARDVVRLIQQARKDAGLDVSDRISLTLQVPGNAAPAVENHAAYIKEQTLADTLALGDVAGHRFTQEVDGEIWVVGVSKAA